MATTTLLTQAISRSGLDPAYTAANADGHTITNGGRMFIHVKNGDTSSKTITVTTPGEVDGLAIADRTVTIAAGEEAVIGPFPPAIYNTDPGVTDKITVTFSAVTSVTIAALTLPAS